MESMLFFHYLCVCVFTLVIISPSKACPVQCACSVHQVDCYGRNLKEIPADIPEFSVYVDLQDNLIETIHPERLFRLPKLESLILRSNKLTRLESGAFANLATLKRLQLGANEIEYIDPDAFVNLESLQVLDLSNNLITNITGMFVNVPSVERLVLTLNQITELTDSSLAGLEQLQYLILARNKISSISESAFSNLRVLSYLVLRGNPVKQVDKLWAGLHVLSFVDLSDCQLPEIPKGLPWSLSILRLGNNSIKIITATDLRTQRYLGVLFIENNLITEVQYGAFSYCPHLTQVDLSGNRLFQLPDSLPANIESLNADNNNIRHIFKNNFDHDSKMGELSLRNNSITDLAANTFDRLTSLTSLNLDDNDIRVMYNMTFSGLRKLRTLSLDRNPIREIQYRALAGMPTLVWLKMSELRSNMTEIKGNFFRDVYSLTTLDLHQSPHLVNTLLEEKEFIWAISSVKYLNIMDNNLEHLSTSILTALPGLRSLKATKNPWRCNSELLPLRKWMEQSPNTFRDVHQMICDSPPNLQGRSILDVSLSEFTLPTMLPSTSSTTTTTATTPPTTNTPTTANITPSHATTPTAASTSMRTSTKTSRVTTATTVTDYTKSSTLQPTTQAEQRITPTSTRSLSSSSTKMPSSKETTTSTHVDRSTTTDNIMSSQPPKATTRSVLSSTLTPATFGKTTDKHPSPPPPTHFLRTTPNTSTRPSTPRQTSAQISHQPTTKRKTSAQPSSSTSLKQSTSSSTLSSSISTTISTTTTTTTHVSSKTADKTQTTRRPKTATMPSSTSSKKQMSRNRTTPIYVNQTTPDLPHSRSTNTRNNYHTTRQTDQITKSSNSPKDNGRSLPSLSSSEGPQNKSLIIGVSTSLLILVVAVVVIIIMVSYHRRKKKASFIDHDVSFSPHHEETSDTVRIINHIQDSSNERHGETPTHKQTEQNQSTNYKQNPKDKMPYDKKVRKTSNSARSPITCISPNDNDDTDMLMDSWS